MTAGVAEDLQLALRLLNERLPLLVEADGEPVRERVAYARVGGDAQRGSLEIVTYRGRRFVFDGVASAAVEVSQRDPQGVPVGYALILDGPDGSRRLTLVA